MIFPCHVVNFCNTIVPHRNTNPSEKSVLCNHIAIPALRPFCKIQGNRVGAKDLSVREKYKKTGQILWATVRLIHLSCGGECDCSIVYLWHAGVIVFLWACDENKLMQCLFTKGSSSSMCSCYRWLERGTIIQSQQCSEPRLEASWAVGHMVRAIQQSSNSTKLEKRADVPRTGLALRGEFSRRGSDSPGLTPTRVRQQGLAQSSDKQRHVHLTQTLKCVVFFSRL